MRSSLTICYECKHFTQLGITCMRICTIDKSNTIMVNKLAVCYRNMKTGNTSVDWKSNFDQTRQRNPETLYIVLHEQYCCYKKQYKLFVKRMKRMYCELARS